jgi:hypothetical protein
MSVTQDPQSAASPSDKPVIQLREDEGALTLADGGFLLYFYPAGDCDRITWLDEQKSEEGRTDEWKAMLARAVFDEVETDGIRYMHGSFTVLLPDGTEFDYLKHVR